MTASSPASLAAQWRTRGDALHASGDARAGGEAHLKALAAAARDPQMVAAATALNNGDLAFAERLLRDQLKRHPTDIGAMRMLAELGTRLGRYGDASALLNRALELAPEFHAARFARALVLARRNQLASALEDTEALLTISPDNVGYINLQASIQVRLGDYESARQAYARVLASAPDQPKIWMSLGHVLKTIGSVDDGVDAYRRSLALAPELGESWWSLANLKVYAFSDKEISAMQSALTSAKASDEDVLHLHFALGKAFEDRESFDQSYIHYDQGNAIRRKQIDYDPDELAGKVARARELLTREFFDNRRGFGCLAADPIFIVGLPRAGSTLVEQILSSHPDIEGTMELPDLDMIARRLGGDNNDVLSAMENLTADMCRELGEEYLDRTRIQRRTNRPYFVDKLPNNWLHAGLIQLILPNARIVDARRHPIACCFSAWKQHFARGQRFTYGFEELARYYADYMALMQHIDAVLPGRVYRVIHEQLVASPEDEIRRMLQQLRLTFDPRCLRAHETQRAVRTASSEQVRRPISNERVEHWRNFEPWLEPLVSRLAPLTESWRGAH